MISLIVYGRNDSYGYNLHKRAALSLNNFGELLTDDRDEILFVDYNTPEGFPTFPEAILDTLTPRARSILRIFRVTEADHKSLRVKTHLRTLEPVARNVALRRSNPHNRWILSTNTDMIFVTREFQSLSDIVSKLDDGHYGLPRFELPEGLWEGLDRSNPQSTLESLEKYGRQFSLNQQVMSWEPHVFDAPGDFQLMLRKDLVKIDGFNEAMTLGWHVDSNIAKRMSLIYGRVQSLAAEIRGYHCDHTRQETPMHMAGASQNSTLRFIDLVSKPSLPKQRGNWGFANRDIAEITESVTSSKRLLDALSHDIEASGDSLPDRHYNASGYDSDEPLTSAVAPFLIDLLCPSNRPIKVSWCGVDRQAAQTIEGLLSGTNPGSFLECANLAQLAGNSKNFLRFCRESDFVVIDFRGMDKSESRMPNEAKTAFAILRALVLSSRISANWANPRIIGIDVVNNRFEGEFHQLVRCARTPYAIGLRHGFVSDNLLKLLTSSLRQHFRRIRSFARRKLIGNQNVETWIRNAMQRVKLK